MKKLFYGCALALSLCAVPLAANCCYPPQCDPCCDPCGGGQDFSGFYVGGNIGIFSHTAHRTDQDALLEDNSGWTTNDVDVTLGVQIGYDWVCGSTLLGFVADWNWTNIEHDLRSEPNDPAEDQLINSSFDWFTTIRGRAGLTVCDALVYVTIGAAVAKFDTQWRDAPIEFNYNNTRWGWTAGFGTEFLVWCNWSIGAEILWLHFSHNERDFTDGATTFRLGHSDSAYVGRILVNYRFGDLFSCCGF